MRDYDEDDIGTEAEAATATVLNRDSAAVYGTPTKEGLLLKVKKIVHTDADSARFEVRYSPNPAMTGNNRTITQAFFLDD